MLYTKSQSHSVLENIVSVFVLTYMGTATILFIGVEPFKRIANIPLIEASARNLVKIGEAVLEKKT